MNFKTKIFADGADIETIKTLNDKDLIKGFTTNPSLMKNSNISDYKEFALSILSTVHSKPVSFEVLSDDLDLMYKEAKLINSWAENIFIKIPIQNTKGTPTKELVASLCNEKVKCNITAIFTISQINELLENLDENSRFILSIFAGRIADTGVDPEPIFVEAKKITEKFSKSEILWASPREAFNIIQANRSKCDIITLTPDYIKKMNNFGKDLNSFSLETVKMFYDDAKSINIEL